MDEQDIHPTIHCLRDTLNDETMDKYSHISDIYVMNTASITPGNMPSCIIFLEENEPDPEPLPTPQSATPPLPIVVSDVFEYGASMMHISPQA